MYVSCLYVHDTIFPDLNVYSGYSAACTFHVSVSTTPSLHNSSSQRACISTPLEMQHACKTEHEPHCPVWPYRKGTLIPTKGPATSEPRNVCKRQRSGDSAGGYMQPSYLIVAGTSILSSLQRATRQSTAIFLAFI